jgi:hypothetical protein
MSRHHRQAQQSSPNPANAPIRCVTPASVEPPRACRSRASPIRAGNVSRTCRGHASVSAKASNDFSPPVKGSSCRAQRRERMPALRQCEKTVCVALQVIADQATDGATCLRLAEPSRRSSPAWAAQLTCLTSSRVSVILKPSPAWKTTTSTRGHEPIIVKAAQSIQSMLSELFGSSVESVGLWGESM